MAASILPPVMELGNILNTKSSVAHPGQPYHLPFDMQSAMPHELQPGPHYSPAPYMNGRIKSETGSERGVSPHPSEHSSRYSSQPAQPMPSYPPPMHNGYSADMRYGSPSHMPVSAATLLNNFNQSAPADPMYPPPQMPPPHHQDPQNGAPVAPKSEGPPKAFACSTCGKGFARRSDLARHERIHSGIRPHVCDYPNCGKQFIQRSALTVHMRVHTGEKPHMCERCGKPFSDSSSLARHRRIHSGKRPYKCPYADCQKTFTRRTTLTRHQNHHTGTVEEAAAATAAALASRAAAPIRTARSDVDDYSEHASPLPTPSPNERTLSLSPAAGMPVVPNMHRPGPPDYGYMNNLAGVPPHLRSEMPHPSRGSSPALTAQSYNSAVSSGGRPSLTSHPSGYGPPQVLEPPTTANHSGQTSHPGSVNGSPHMSHVGWQSPSQQPLPSPTAADGYVYPEPGYGQQAPTMYYPNSNIRRPQSTEPDAYNPQNARMAHDVWGATTVQ